MRIKPVKKAATRNAWKTQSERTGPRRQRISSSGKDGEYVRITPARSRGSFSNLPQQGEKTAKEERVGGIAVLERKEEVLELH